ncbi:hypothetical protein B0H13DRAFT_2512247 [Mycena leptocephala]|nr:hypothetical protein B0H13DRAFT_2512247 [Mycena leptocephala]
MILLDSVYHDLPPSTLRRSSSPPRLHRVPRRDTPTSSALPLLSLRYATLWLLFGKTHRSLHCLIRRFGSRPPSFPPLVLLPRATPSSSLGPALTVFTVRLSLLLRSENPTGLYMPKLSCLIGSYHDLPLSTLRRSPPPPRRYCPESSDAISHPSAVYPDATPQPPFGSAPLLPVLLYRRNSSPIMLYR